MVDTSTQKKHLDLGGLLRRQFGLYVSYFWQIYGVTLLLLFLPLLLSLVLLGPSGSLKWFANVHIEQSVSQDEGGAAATGGQSANGGTGTSTQEAGATAQGGEAANAPAQTDAGEEVLAAAGFWTSIPVEVAAEAVVRVLFAALYMALMALFVFEVRSGITPRFSALLPKALLRVIPILVVNCVVLVLILLGFVLLLFPGLWLYGVFAVVVPVVAVEGRFLGALRRSAALTKGFRWPCLGYLMVLFVLVVALTFALSKLTGFVAMTLMPIGATASALLALLLFLVLFALFVPIAALAAPVLYVRLRALKAE